jgi:hypothetical protein
MNHKSVGIRNLKTFVSVMLIGVLGGCAAPQPAVPKIGYVAMADVRNPLKFEAIEFTKLNFGPAMVACISTWPATATQRFLADWKIPLPRNTRQMHLHNGHASYMVIEGGKGACIQQSEKHFPILAAEALNKTVNPSGVPPDVADEWNQKIAAEIAKTGYVTVNYSFENGNAFVAKYWVDTNRNAAEEILYFSEFKRTGQWQAEPSQLKFSHPGMTSVLVTKYGDRHAKSFIHHWFD